ncbi:MAG: threonine--tRNA ligase [Candidatus Cloacimonetes bacterium]|nr:threonine--tRNA ligase [Candidatus Cloacimonadota bacterium]
MIKITFPDNTIREYPKGTTPFAVASDISQGLAQNVIAAELDGKMVDLDYPIEKDAKIVFLKFSDEKGKEIYWHSTAHLMAQAVKELFPDVKIAIGPAIEEGFYYDFEREDSFTDEELEKIEQKMKEICKNKNAYKRIVTTREEALRKFSEIGESYKVELLEAIPEGDTITMYSQGTFTDLCRGPHVSDTGRIKSFKLLKTSGAYWRGDEKNKMLKRIYGISFPSSKDLKNYLQMLEEAKKRDHRKIGKELDLYSISEDIGPGLVLWHPNGAMMRNIIENFWKEEHLKHGYKLVYSPHIGKADLWITSGHLGFYKDSMYNPFEVDGQDYYVKPMNCPFHISIYNDTKRSYRELPVRYAEMGTVYRFERSGALHGLMRVRGFTQDDAHIFCTPEQMETEVDKVIFFSFRMLKAFGFEGFQVYLSTMPEKAVGNPDDWEKATLALRNSLEKFNIAYQVDQGGGAFYGPKIDIKIKDALNRSWQCSTIQFDFNLSERFNLEYIGKDNKPHRPFMIHRALLGSMERFFGTLIEYHGGNFPTWLCPIQIMVIPLSESFDEYAMKIRDELNLSGIRAEIDLRSEKIGYKIREAEIKKVPFMAIVGQKELENSTISLRKHTEGDKGSYSLSEAIELINADITAGKKIDQ